MLLKEAELLFHAGVLDQPTINYNDEMGGWLVTLAGTHHLKPELETARGGVRVFKRLDAAVGLLFEVGFTEVSVLNKP